MLVDVNIDDQKQEEKRKKRKKGKSGKRLAGGIDPGSTRSETADLTARLSAQMKIHARKFSADD
jgi:hypothetical protein